MIIEKRSHKRDMMVTMVNCIDQFIGYKHFILLFVQLYLCATALTLGVIFQKIKISLRRFLWIGQVKVGKVEIKLRVICLMIFKCYHLVLIATYQTTGCLFLTKNGMELSKDAIAKVLIKIFFKINILNIKIKF